MVTEEFQNLIYSLVRAIPRGRVATYGQLALLAGYPERSRMVGRALRDVPRNLKVPCHRVVNRFGFVSPAFAFGGAEAQSALLRAEGVEVSGDGKVDLGVYGWRI